MPLSPLHSAEWLQLTSSPADQGVPAQGGRASQISSASLTFTGRARAPRRCSGSRRESSASCPISRASSPAGHGRRTLGIGYAAYANEAGTTIVAAATALASALADGVRCHRGSPSRSRPSAISTSNQPETASTSRRRSRPANTPASGECFLAIAYTRAGLTNDNDSGGRATARRSGRKSGWPRLRSPRSWRGGTP